MLFLLASAAWAATAYLRYPDLHGEQVVFSAGGDLWIAGLDGGTARRLTAHGGDERFPYFSPDGSLVAFTADYEGDSDVYVVPAAGGEPRRLTWQPGADEVVGWLRGRAEGDPGTILFRTRELHPLGSDELFGVSPRGGDPGALPLGMAGRLDEEGATGMWAFNRLPGERRTWKRYRGGTASDIWVGHPQRADFRKVTSFAGMDDFPMWHGGRIWFLSDAGGTADIWSMQPDGSDRERHTQGGTWDARYPAMGPDGRIVYMRAGDLWLFDPGTGEDRALSIDVPLERASGRRRYPDAAEYLTWASLSPDGERVLVGTRGELFAVPAEEGLTLPLTRGSAARERWGAFSPDGGRVVYVTDVSGEESIVTADAWGRGGASVVRPAGASGWLFPPAWSPDGARIAWADQTQSLYVAPAAGGPAVLVDASPQEEITQYAWSPDGRYLAYTRKDNRDFGSIHVYDTRDGVSRAVTPPSTDSHSPAWDPDGRYLYFLSDRTINPVLGNRDFEAITARSCRPYLLVLDKDARDPFAPERGLPPGFPGAPTRAEKKEEKKEEKKRRKGAIVIDFAGLAERAVPLPVEPGDYSDLAATGTAVFYLSHPLAGLIDQEEAEEEPQGTLMRFDLEEEEESELLEGVAGFEAAPDAEKLLALRGEGELLVLAADEEPDDPEPLDLSGVVVELDPAAEWRQMYFEAWRHMRDFHWEPGMGGLDWIAVRDQYAALLPRISTREELEDLLGEVIGELGTSHTYVWGGDYDQDVDWVGTGLLGADVAREAGGGPGDFYRITRIYRGDPADNVASPLLAPGVNLEEGDYILAVNNQPLRPDRPFLASLEGRAGVPVLLTVSDGPTREGARDVLVTPVESEAPLRYADWVRRNREYVAEKSGGRFGYVHVPDMDTAGLVAFETWFYPQLDKEGLVIDVRWNGGGYVSQLILERLRRELLSYDRSRAGGVWTYPYRVLNGPFVVLINEQAGSDGDIFPYAVQRQGLAPLIGTRTWGGIIGIRGDKPLVDGGILTQPEYATWYPGGGWLIENHGVDPDIEVVSPPQAEAKGQDLQLDAAIAELQRRHAAEPPVKPEFGDPPRKSRGAFAGELE